MNSFLNQNNLTLSVEGLVVSLAPLRKTFVSASGGELASECDLEFPEASKGVLTWSKKKLVFKAPDLESIKLNKTKISINSSHDFVLPSAPMMGYLEHLGQGVVVCSPRPRLLRSPVKFARNGTSDIGNGYERNGTIYAFGFGKGGVVALGTGSGLVHTGECLAWMHYNVLKCYPDSETCSSYDYKELLSEFKSAEALYSSMSRVFVCDRNHLFVEGVLVPGCSIVNVKKHTELRQALEVFPEVGECEIARVST